MIIQKTFSMTTQGRGLINITSSVAKIVNESAIFMGLCNVFLHHTSASIILSENSDILVQHDLERFMGKLIPDGDEMFQHVDEGPDDMPSHVRTVLTQNSISIPVTDTQLNLGQWQGIFLWEHRLKEHTRHMTVTVFGTNNL